MGQVQLVRALLEEGGLIGAFRIRFQRSACFVEGRRHPSGVAQVHGILRRGQRRRRRRPHRGRARAEVGQAKASYRFAQLRRQGRKLRDGSGRRSRAFGGLRRDFAHDLHVLGDIARGDGLLPSAGGYVLHQTRDLIRHLLDLFERGTRVFRKQCPPHDIGRAAFHRDHRFIGIRLDSTHQHLDLLRGVGRTFGQPLYFIRDHGKTASCLARHRRLNRGIQRENIRLLGNVVDELDDVADLLRALAETFDSLAGLLDGLANRVHTIDGAANGVPTLVCNIDRVPRHVGASLGIPGNFLDRRRHILH